MLDRAVVNRSVIILSHGFVEGPRNGFFLVRVFEFGSLSETMKVIVAVFELFLQD